MRIKNITTILLYVTAGICGAYAQTPAAGDTSQERIPHKEWKMKVRTKAGTLPASVENNKYKYFPPVISQIGGSCAQASTIGYVCTYELNRLLDRSASDPANRCSYLYSWNFINGGKDEGSLSTDGLDLAYNAGLMSDADFPRQTSAYQFRWASGYERYYRALHNKVSHFNDIEIKTMEDITRAKHYLYDKNEEGRPGGILVFSSQAEGWRFDENYNGPSETGITVLLTRLGNDGPHAMTITGYDDLVEFTAPDGTIQHGAFIVTNTHGSFRHDKGRFYLPYWFFLHEKDGLILGKTLTGATIEHKAPEIVFRATFEYSSRDDLNFKIGVSGKLTDKVPTHDYIVPIMNNQGGDFQMQGSDSKPEMREMDVAFDFSMYADRLEGMETPNFFLTVTRGKRGSKYGEGKIHSVAVYDYRKSRTEPLVYRKDLGDAELKEGANIFSIPSGKIPETSFSPVTWLNKYEKPVAAPLVFKTAKGKYAKVRFSEYDRENGTIRMKYVYNPNGSRNLE